MYDQRLFNQEGGMASGLASEDTYNLYDKALFADRGNNLYKPRTTADDDEAGEADGKIPEAMAKFGIPNTSFKSIPNAGHMPMLEDHKAFMDALAGFL